MKVVFFGTPEFAVPSLQALLPWFQVVAVVTRPDAPRGRGQDRLEPPPVALAARAAGLPVLQPRRPSEPGFLETLTALTPDALAVAAYGHLIPDPHLAAAPLGAWNVHPSLLPRWRGPAPVHRALAVGDAETGVTIIRLIARLDAGPMARRQATPIAPGETRSALEARLAAVGAEMLVTTLREAGDGAVRLTPQDDAAATYAGMFSREEGELKWAHPADELDRLVRALAPSPGAWFALGADRIKVLAAAPGGVPPAGASPGTLVRGTGQAGWSVACGTGALVVREVQPPGKGRMPFAAFLAGRRLAPGSALAD